MSRLLRFQPDQTSSVKESSKMAHRSALKVVFPLAMLFLLLLPTAYASAAPAPWWQVLTGSRPTNLWEPKPSLQEIETETEEFLGEQVSVIQLKVNGTAVGCLGTKGFFGNLFCEGNTGFPSTENAAELQALLETAVGGGGIEVTGGPVGGDPLKVSTSGAAPAIEVATCLSPPCNEGENELGAATLKVISAGGSGRLVATVTNIGNADVDATKNPVTITSELPEGVVASGVEAYAGVKDSYGPVDCAVESSSLVGCTFEGNLPPYEAIEVEVIASLTGSPPVAGAPGKVTVSGGNVPTASASQGIKVSPEETPFGIEQYSAQAEEERGDPVIQAGSHPFQVTTTIQLNAGEVIPGSGTNKGILQPAAPRNLRFSLPAGLVGNATAVARCDMEKFFTQEILKGCPAETAVGVVSATVVESNILGLTRVAVPLFNLPPAQGEPARLGFGVEGASVVIDTAVDPDDQYKIIAEVRNATQIADFLSSTVVLWGSPGDPRHDESRGWGCTNGLHHPPVEVGPCERPSSLSEDAFLRQPVSCVTPLEFGTEIEPWNVPTGSVIEDSVFDAGTMSGCNQVPFDPSVNAAPTNRQTRVSSGLDFQLEMPNAGLLNAEAIAEGQAKKAEVILPEGMTINPSQAEGLAACSPAQYAAETASSPPGAGCPEASKVGTVRVSTPLLEEEAKGSLYVAKPYDNPFNSLLAIYMVAKVPERGVLIKQAGKVALDPNTGQIVSTFDNLPQLPFDTFRVNFFEGGRAPLVTPPDCGTYELVAKFTPWSAADPNNPLPSEIVEQTSPFTVNQGANGRPCPSGTRPFNPDLVAGTESNSAGSFSPFSLRLTRNDEEQEFSRLSVKLPKGVLGILAGIPFCPDASIAAASARTGPNGAQEELDNPSCPTASQLGSTLVGAGVGSELSYAPGKVYLAGPYQGAKLSIVVIATAKVGPFDLGNVVIRQALRVNPDTAEVTADGTSAAPIPRILQGVVTYVRDIRVNLDRSRFMFNPTNCEPMTAAATVFSVSGLAANVSSPFQAADCASLGFKPKMSLQLLGGTKRTATPRLKAVLTTRKGDANFGRVQVTLPRSAFLEQAHIRTVCTRVQFNAGGGNGEQCPKAAIYGKMQVTTPLLDEVAKGPVFLRSSDNELPDLVAALHAPRGDVNLVGRIDSLNGRIRTTFDAPPDVPFTKAILEMQGGQKGLIVNSTNICKGKHTAIANLKGQNGRRYEFNPVVKAQCGGKKGGKRK